MPAQSGGFSPEFDHLALAVDLDEPWLVDVGFGNGFRLPVRLNDAADQPQGKSTYLIVEDGEYRVLLRRDAGGDWTPQYRFTLQPHTLDRFRRTLPVPSDFARIQLHARPHLHAGHTRRARHAQSACG